VIAARDPPAYEWFAHALRALVFFDYPHREPDIAHLRQQIYRQMMIVDETFVSPVNIAAATETLPEIITEINNMFIQSRIMVQVRIVNFVSSSNRASDAFEYVSQYLT
jgi:hypothetical protein